MTPTEDQQKDIRWALDEMTLRRHPYLLHGGYYVGRQAQMINQRRLRTIFGRLFRDFRLNLCSPVVDALADRLEIQTFSGTDDEQSGQDAYDIWTANRLDRRANMLHRNAISHGDAYVLVWPNRYGEPIVYPQSPFEVAVRYDTERPGKIVRAAKLWQEEESSQGGIVHGPYRLTLYYEDRIEKYTSAPRTAGQLPGATDFEERSTEGETWPLANTYGVVPIFHLANNADLGNYGVSELRDAISVQDWLNYAVFSLLVGQEFQAFPQRYAIGVEVPKNEDGNPVNPFKAGPDRMWIANPEDPEKAPTMGQFTAADLDKMLNVKREISLTMAQITATPASHFSATSDQVSGESQKTMEQKLDSKVRDRQMSFGDTWSEVMALAVRMRRGGSVDGLQLETEWADTKPRNELEVLEAAQAKVALGVSREQVLREMGYTEDEIERFAAERRTEESGTLQAEPEMEPTQ